MSRLAGAIGAVVLLLGGYLAYLDAEVLDAASAGDRGAAALADDADLRDALAPTIASAIGTISPVGAPSSEAVSSALAAPGVGDAFGAEVSATVDELTGPDRPRPPVLDLGKVTAAAVAVTDSPVPNRVAGRFDSAQVELRGAGTAFDALELLAGLELLAYVMMASGGVLLLAALLLARRPAEGVLSVGLSVALAAFLGGSALVIGRTLLGAIFDDELTRDAVEGTWDAFFGELLTTTAIAAAAGVILAVGAGLALSRRR